MNLNYHTETELADVKRILLKQIIETQQHNETMVLRCNKLREMIDLFNTRI